MINFVNSLCNELSLNNLWGVVGSAVPIIAISVLFGLGIILIDYAIFNINYPDSSYKSSGVVHKGYRKF